MDKSFITDNTDEAVIQVMRKIRDEQEGIHIPVWEIAQRVGCHHKTATNAIKRLSQKGQLRIIACKGKPTRYEILG